MVALLVDMHGAMNSDTVAFILVDLACCLSHADKQFVATLAALKRLVSTFETSFNEALVFLRLLAKTFR